MRRIPLKIAVLGLVATACGGTADAEDGVASLDAAELVDTAVPTVAPELSQEEALLAFTQCLRDNGIDVADPTVDSDGNLRLSRPANTGQDQGQGRNEEFRAAREACGELLEGVTLGFRDVDQTELEDTLLEFAACMRDNGYEDMPDPDLSAFGTPGQGGGGPFGQLDPDDPAFQAAQEVCQDILAGLGPPPGGDGRGRGSG